MKNLLIVEDEKMIRQGIHAMVMRSPVSIDNIILCKNGEEAYEILKQQRIDVMITDIRMPKKDGITLVKEIQSLAHVPKIIVISGYDDFNYAVELLRFGAKEYMLKPVEREKINEILCKLEKEIETEISQEKDTIKIGNQQVKYILLNSNITQTELDVIETKFHLHFLCEGYVICCTNYKTRKEITMKDVIYLDDINGQSVFIVKATKKEELLSELLKGHNIGISRKHNTLAELIEAYHEAYDARKKAFAVGCFISEYDQPDRDGEMISEEMIDQFVQMIGTNKLEQANKFILHILYKTKQGSISPKQFESIMKAMVDKICENYKNILDFSSDNSRNFSDIYQYDNAEIYCIAISNWIEVINEKLHKEFCDYKNKQKIQRAITYIQDNYSSNLNMAVVSNCISMNYSLFSYEFKQYTGMNFVNYLKAIRMNEAKRLLEETEYKIIEISKMIGYDNEKNFMKSFKIICGVSPSEYRKNVQVGKLRKQNET